MKILYLMTEPFGYGGVQSDMLALSRDLVPRGHEVFVATAPGELLQELQSRGGQHLDIDFHFSAPLKFLRAARALRQAVIENQIDIVAPQSVRSSLISFFALRMWPFRYRVADTERRCPIVTTIHNIHNPVHFRYAGKILRLCCDYVIFESHYERDRVTASGLPSANSEVVHSGIDTEQFSPQPVNTALCEQFGIDKSRHKVFGIVARLSEEKGHDHLLHAFVEVQRAEPEARLFVIGNGPLLEPTKQLATQLQLDDSVIFTGGRRDIPEFLSVIDVFVLSSTRESFPLAAREAMAAGRAVIAPAIGGCPEVVDDGVTGYLFESANRSDLAAKMLDILQQQRYEKFGASARDRVVKLFSRKQWIDGDERVYEQAHLAQTFGAGTTQA